MGKLIDKLDDNSLIRRTLAGETECFSVLVERHTAAVRLCIYRLARNPCDVEDLVQNTFLKAWQHLPQFRFEAAFRTWLLSVAVNEALALHRRRKCRPCFPGFANLETFPSQCESPHQAFTRAEAHIRIHRAVAKLPQKYRQVLELCDLQQLTMRETAGRMQLKAALVKTRLFRARHMLSAALSEEAA